MGGYTYPYKGRRHADFCREQTLNTRQAQED